MFYVKLSCLDLTFNLAIVNLSLKILSGLYPRNCKVKEVYTYERHWLGVGVLCNCVTLISP